jgi:D-methionine transport system substrate-binding protein
VAEPCLHHAISTDRGAPNAKGNHMSHRTKLIAALAAVPLLVGLAACASPASGDGGDAANDVVKIGVVGAGDPQWAAFEAAAADEGITIEVVDFADYAQPNPATTEGELDLNQFQHIVYLADYNVSSGEDLTPIGSTAIYPLGLYSTKYDSVKDIPEGETVAVPNDASNQARALLVLQSAGLIELKSGGTIFSDLADIDESASKVKVTALEASLTPTSLPDVAAAIINNDFVEDAGLKFEDAIAQDDPSDPNALPYVNIFASRADDKDNATYLQLVEIFQTNAEVQAALVEASGGTALPVQTPVADLVDSLAKVEADTEAAQR